MKKLDILYEDNDLIVINKEAKILTISDQKGSKNLYAKVSLYVKKQNPHHKIFIVHRLDKDTSGLIVFAKNIKAKNILQKNWSMVKREYVAVVEGRPASSKMRLVNFLKETKTHLVYVSKTGKEAITNYEVMNTNGKYSLLKINIETGRKNQIRVQLSNISHPIVGDKKYGAQTNPLNRLALQANYLEFKHPITKKLMQFKLDIPKEFNEIVRGEK